MYSSIVYYLLLYLLVILIRFFKLWKDYAPNKGTGNDRKFPFKKVAFVSLEIVYTSAGFVGLLLENQKGWILPIVMFYIMLVIISSNFDSMDEKFGENAKLVVHTIVILIIVTSTVIAFNTVLKPADEKTENTSSSFKVILPYVDNSLVSHIGYEKIGNKKFIFVTNIDSTSSKKVVNKAISLFWQDKSTLPFKLKKEQSKEDVVKIDFNNIEVIKQ